MPFTSFLAFYFLAPIFLALFSVSKFLALAFLVSIEALAFERITILKLSSIDKPFNSYLFDFEPTSKLSLNFDSIEDERVALEKVNYSKIDFFKKKAIFKKIGFKGEIVVLSALRALSKYFIIIIRLLVIDIVNERNLR